MNNRPVLKLPYTLREAMVQLAAVGVLIIAWTLSILYHNTLPDTIPIHFNFAGEPDGYGEKGYIFAMPIIATIIFVVLGLLAKVPHQFNYLTPVTEANAEQQYRWGRMLLFVLSLLVALLAVWAVWKMAQV
ncbi:MAG: DUF1648 domain-containing protein [Saprospiraceae bacterium]|nr:DUF1648 domain-containing protein [Saprospiraceae bacterium]